MDFAILSFTFYKLETLHAPVRMMNRFVGGVVQLSLQQAIPENPRRVTRRALIRDEVTAGLIVS